MRETLKNNKISLTTNGNERDGGGDKEGDNKRTKTSTRDTTPKKGKEEQYKDREG